MEAEEKQKKKDEDLAKKLEEVKAFIVALIFI